MFSSILSNLFTFQNLLLMNIGVAAGILIGAAPGLSVAFAVTILLTMTYHMNSIAALVLMLGAYCGGMFGGSITATLINTPGTANAVCTALEGYPLARRGRAGDAMKLALVASTIGGVFSCLCLLFFAPQLAKVVLKITSPEYFALCCFGIFAAIGLEGKTIEGIIKGFMSACFGLLLGCVGSDPVYGSPRLLFGNYRMMSGIKTITVLLGAYALCQILVNSRVLVRDGEESMHVEHVGKSTITFRDILKHWKTILKSSLIGTIVGAIPGTGGAVSAMFAYNEAKRSSKHPEEFGNGSIEGILAAESANNATTGGAMIPMLTLGIPGDAVMAILLGALTMQGISPGPNLFNGDGRSWVYTIMFSLILINIFMYFQGRFFVNAFSQIAKVPQMIMIPCIVIMSMFGSYAISNNTFECTVMVVFGLVGFIMKRFGFPIPPLCISLVLCSLFETNLRRSLILSDYNWAVFFTRPISCVIMILSVLMMFMPIITNALSKRKAKKNK